MVVGDHRGDRSVDSSQWRRSDGAPPHFDFWRAGVRVTFYENKIALGKHGRVGGVLELTVVHGIPVALGRWPEDGIHGRRTDPDDGRPSLSVAMRIFARSVEFVLVVGMLDRAHTEPRLGKHVHELSHQRCFSVILPADDVYAIHGSGVAPLNVLAVRPTTPLVGKLRCCWPILVGLGVRPQGRFKFFGTGKENKVFLMDMLMQVNFQSLERVQHDEKRIACVLWWREVVRQLADAC